MIGTPSLQQPMRTPARRAFRYLTPILAVVALTTCRSEGSDEGGPTRRLVLHPGINVLVVSFDALRADALGLYGGSRGLSPNLDRFASQAWVFDRAFTSAPVTPTSFAAAFTGQYPHEVFRGWSFVAQEPLAKRFSAAGYATAAFINNVQLTPERGFGRGFDEFLVNTPEVESDEGVLAASLRWLSDEAHRPFFAWVHFLDPHAPYDRRDFGEHLYDSTYAGPFAETSGPLFEAADADDARRLRDLYDGEILYVDRLFGALIDELERSGMFENTLVVITADHGEEFLERGVYQHKHLYDETTRIPLLLRHPSGPAGQRNDQLASNVDLLPTVLAVAGLPVPEGLDGIDLGAENPADRAILSLAMTDRHYRAATIRTDEWRLILECQPEQEVLLYHLASDPEERIVRTDDSRPVAHRLLQTLQAEIGDNPCVAIERAVEGRDPAAGLDTETIDTLKSLGYLGS